jgi:hypothetical protein
MMTTIGAALSGGLPGRVGLLGWFSGACQSFAALPAALGGRRALVRPHGFLGWRVPIPAALLTIGLIGAAALFVQALLGLAAVARAIGD